MKVVLVDDEYMILRGLPKLIALTDLDLTVEMTFQNPLEAVEYLRKNHVDILISDMNMLEMKGPEFLQKVNQIQPGIALIVLSGYADFEYVKAGIQQGAIDYLRKPVDPDELKETLEVAIKKVTKQQQNQTNANMAKGVRLRELLTLEKAYQKENLLANLGLQTTDSMYLLAVLNPIPVELLLDHLENIPEVCGCFKEKRDVLFLFVGKRSRLNQFLHELPVKVSPLYRPVIVSSKMDDPALLFRAYGEIMAEIGRQYFFESSHGLTMLEEGKVTQIMAVIPKFSKLKEAIAQLKDVEDFKQWLNLQLNDLKKQHVTVALVRQYALLVALALRESSIRYSLTAPENVAVINSAKTIGEIEAVLANVQIDGTRGVVKRYSFNITRVLEIIEKDYSQPLTLIDIADKLHLNSVYLGALFKQEVGASFAKYLNEWRIAQAIELLQKTDEDINQIAVQVGYQNSSYFFRIFKQHTKMSPKEYRAMTNTARKMG